MHDDAILTNTGRTRAGPPVRRDAGHATGSDASDARLLDALERQQLAEQTLRRQTESLAQAVHELRGPLMPLRNVCALLAKGPGAVDLAKLATVLDRQVQHMSRLIDDLLDASRMATGRLHVRPARIDLVALLGQIVDAFQPSMNARAQRFTASIPQGSLVVDADEVRLAQVFTNLLHNASKYTPQGGAITLSCTVEAGHGLSYVAIAIADNGVGITSTALPKVFEPFVQDSHAVGFAADGLGIGLALVRELVRAHGGTVAATSPGPGRGSRFTVRLPLARAIPPHERRGDPTLQARLHPLHPGLPCDSIPKDASPSAR